MEEMVPTLCGQPGGGPSADDGSVRAALLEAVDMVEAGPCAAVARARGRYRSWLSHVPLPRPSRHRDRDGGKHPALCWPLACRGAQVAIRPRSTPKAIGA